VNGARTTQVTAGQDRQAVVSLLSKLTIEELEDRADDRDGLTRKQAEMPLTDCPIGAYRHLAMAAHTQRSQWNSSRPARPAAAPSTPM
jgi:hypothetical protein